MSPPLRAVCFDLDGTLVRGTTVSLHLSRWLGHEALCGEWERQYAEGVIDNATFAELDARHYRGRLRSDIWRELDDIPVVNGIAKTLDWLRANDVTPLLATVTLASAAEFFADRYGFEATFGCEMDEDSDGRMLGTVRRSVEPEDKARFLIDYCATSDLTLSQCAAVGDSRLDIPLFSAVGLAIAFNATEPAKAAADVVIDADDLRTVIPLLSDWLRT